jgi:hypothetical protein
VAERTIPVACIQTLAHDHRDFEARWPHVRQHAGVRPPSHSHRDHQLLSSTRSCTEILATRSRLKGSLAPCIRLTEKPVGRVGALGVGRPSFVRSLAGLSVSGAASILTSSDDRGTGSHPHVESLSSRREDGVSAGRPHSRPPCRRRGRAYRESHRIVALVRNTSRASRRRFET